MVPRWPKIAQDGHNMAQDGPEMAPKLPEMAPNWPQDGPKYASGWHQDSPRWPMMVHGRPKMTLGLEFLAMCINSCILKCSMAFQVF